MKRKVLPAIILMTFLSTIPVFSVQDVSSDELAEDSLQEVKLEIPLYEENAYDLPEVISVSANKDELKEKSLKEKLHDVYNLEVEKYDKPNYLLKEVFIHKYPEKSFMDYTHFWAGYNGDFGISFIEDEDVSKDYDFNAITATIDGVAKNNNADFRMMLRFMPKSHRNVMQTMFSDMYIGTNKIPHHRIQVGYFRPKVGREGTMSSYLLPFLSRAQISREFGTVRKIGAKIEGDYSFIDYNLGVYSSGTYFRDFFPGAEFAGWIDFKPLAKVSDKYGKLKIGGGLQGGHRTSDYCVTGAYVSWEYKKLFTNFEWAKANGYNGNSGDVTKRHADGFYATIGYMLTKKLQLLARYDQFDSDNKVSHNDKREYSVGLNYFVKGQALRLILNYVFCQKQGGKDSHRIMLGTQILL